MVDVLSKLLVRVEKRGLFEGFLVGRNKTRASHLQFANDTIFFSRASLEDLQTLKQILMVFRHLSGLQINLNKNTLSRINISHDQTTKLASLLDCAVFECPLSYLGLPLGGNPNLISFWDPVLDGVSRRLDSWKKTFLSLRGRITLI